MSMHSLCQLALGALNQNACLHLEVMFKFP